MTTKFSNYNDILKYLDIEDISRNQKNINLRESVFDFKLDFDSFLESLNNRYRELESVDFSGSVFKYSLVLYLTKQETVYDEKNNVEEFIYRKTKIKVKLDFGSCHFMDYVQFSGIEFCKDLNINNSIFEKEVKFTEITFNQYFRLFETTFNDDVTFAYLELGSKSIFFTNMKDKPKFKRDVIFVGVTFNEAKFWDFDFPNDVYFQNSVFDCLVFFNNSRVGGKINFTSLETIGLTEFKNKVYFDYAQINELTLERIIFEKPVSFNYTKISSVSIENVHCLGISISLVGTIIDIVKDEGTARFFKTEAMKSNNPFLVAELNTKEMTMHYKELKWNKHFFDKLIFILNKSSTNYGEKWEKGVLFIILTWLISFSCLVMLRDGIGKTFIWFDKEYIQEAIQFLWQFGSLNILKDSNSWSNIYLLSLGFFVFIIGKILIIYGVYQTIAAFRKYGKK